MWWGTAFCSFYAPPASLIFTKPCKAGKEVVTPFREMKEFLVSQLGAWVLFSLFGGLPGVITGVATPVCQRCCCCSFVRALDSLFNQLVCLRGRLVLGTSSLSNATDFSYSCSLHLNRVYISEGRKFNVSGAKQHWRQKDPQCWTHKFVRIASITHSIDTVVHLAWHRLNGEHKSV